MNLSDMTLDVAQHIEIATPREEVFEALFARLGEKNVGPDGTPLTMRIERQVGGRWFRDLDERVGHLWGTVQSIRPPRLLEITGPLFMSYPVINHIEFKLEESDVGTLVNFRHRAIGFIDPNHRAGVTKGWESMLVRLKEDCG